MSMKKRVLIVVAAIFALGVIGNNLGGDKGNSKDPNANVSWYVHEDTAAVLSHEGSSNHSLLTVEVVNFRGQRGGLVKFITPGKNRNCSVRPQERTQILVDGEVINGYRACVQNGDDVFNMAVFSGNSGAAIISAFENSTTGYVTIQGEKFTTKNHRQVLQKVIM